MITRVLAAAIVMLVGFGFGTELQAACSAQDKKCAFDANAYLRAHNQHRAKHCVPALRWDAAVAAKAQAWANRCVFEHEPQRTRGAVGENLYFRGPVLNDPAAGVDAWYGEIKQYNFKTTRSIPGTGHFTQVVWKASTNVGCAVSACPNLKGVIMVCRYSPQGNMTFNNKWLGTENVPQVCKR